MTAEATTTDPPATGTTTDPPATGTPDPTPDRLPEDHPAVKALAKANKEAETLRLKVKEFEDASKSELEKLTEKAATAEERAAAAELRALRLEVAEEAGVPAKLRKYVVGETREELVASAKEILEAFKQSDEKKPSKLPAKPKPEGGSGNGAGDLESLEGKKRAAAALRQFRNVR